MRSVAPATPPPRHHLIGAWLPHRPQHTSTPSPQTKTDRRRQVPAAHAKLTAGDPVKNAQAILRYALPVDNKPIREAQVGACGDAAAAAAARRLD